MADVIENSSSKLVRKWTVLVIDAYEIEQSQTCYQATRSK